MYSPEGLGHCEEVTRAVGTLESVHSPGITKEVRLAAEQAAVSFVWLWTLTLTTFLSMHTKT